MAFQLYEVATAPKTGDYSSLQIAEGTHKDMGYLMNMKVQGPKPTNGQRKPYYQIWEGKRLVSSSANGGGLNAGAKK